MIINVDTIRNHFRSELESENFILDKTGQLIIECIGASFIADEPSIFGEPNEEYINSEIAWYKSLSSNINDIHKDAPPPAAWQYAANAHGEINSNYGLLIWSKKYFDQYQNVLNELINNPGSRRGTMVYTRPSIWAEYNENGKSDFICTNAVTYYIRNDHWPPQLDAVVQMRSNDVVYGYKNDYAWQRYVQSKLANALDIQPGKLHWQVQNLHVYERHFDLVK